jgi:hypothetical protein
MVDGKLVFTTGKATTWLDGPNLSLLADGNVTVQSGGEVVIEGGPHVRINCQPVSGKAPKPDVSIADGARKPMGRVLGAVKKVFGQTPEEQARRKAVELIVKAQDLIDRWNEGDQQHFASWFGSASAQDRGLIRDRLQQVKAILAEARLVRDDLEQASTFAHVSMADASRTIHLAPAFWNAPLTGEDSKAGTLCHEASHFVGAGATVDHAYGQASALALAKQYPAQALENADNFEYWLETLP